MLGLRAATTSRPACWRHGARFASTVSAAQRKLVAAEWAKLSDEEKAAYKSAPAANDDGDE